MKYLLLFSQLLLIFGFSKPIIEPKSCVAQFVVINQLTSQPPNYIVQEFATATSQNGTPLYLTSKTVNPGETYNTSLNYSGDGPAPGCKVSQITLQSIAPVVAEITVIDIITGHTIATKSETATTKLHTINVDPAFRCDGVKIILSIL